MNDQETRGKVKQVTGRVKEAAGILTGDEKMEQEGAKDRVEGTVQEAYGKATRKVGEFVDGVKKAIED